MRWYQLGSSKSIKKTVIIKLKILESLIRTVDIETNEIKSSAIKLKLTGANFSTWQNKMRVDWEFKKQHTKSQE